MRLVKLPRAETLNVDQQFLFHHLDEVFIILFLVQEHSGKIIFDFQEILLLLLVSRTYVQVSDVTNSPFNGLLLVRIFFTNSLLKWIYLQYSVLLTPCKNCNPLKDF